MNKKLLMLLAAGALAITGCAAKEAVKNTNSNSDSEKSSTTQKNSSSSNSETKNIKHDLVAADKLIKVVGLSGNDLTRLKEQTNFLAYLTQERVTKSKSTNGEELFTISKEDYLDIINEMSAKTYNINEALDLIKGPNFNEYEVSSDKSPLHPTKNEIHYYKGDDRIVFVGVAPSSNRPLEVESQDKWIEKDDSITINVVDAMTKTPVATYTLKLNNKQYSGGHEKSKYYVAEVKTA